MYKNRRMWAAGNALEMSAVTLGIHSIVEFRQAKDTQ